MSFLNRTLSPAARRRWRVVGSLAFMGYSLAFLKADTCAPAAAPGDPVAKIELSEDSLQLELGATRTVTAHLLNATDQPIRDRDVSWSSTNTAVVAVTPDGRQAAVVKGVAYGTAKIIASAEGFSDTGVVVVASPEVPVARVQLSSSAISMRPQDSLNVTAAAFDANDNLLSGRAYTWAVANSSVASVHPVSAGSAYIAAHTLGTTTFTVTAGGVSATGTITVAGAPQPWTMRASMDTVKLTPGSQGAITFTVHDRTGTPLPDSSFAVSITNTAIARFTTPTPTATGRTTLGITGVATGSTFVQASTGRASLAVPVVVRAAPVDSVVVTPGMPLTLPLTGSATLSAKVYAGGKELTDSTVAWSSTNAAVVSVSASGNSATLSPKSAGTASVIATSGGKADTVAVTVTSAAPKTLVVNPVGVFTTKRLASGATETFNNMWVAGDHEANGDKSLQAFNTFLLDGLPAGSTVTKAQIAVRLDPTLEGSPFSLGPLMVELAEGSTLNEGALAAGAVTVASAATPTSLTVDVTSLINAARAAGRQSALFRYRFTQLGNNNAQTDYLNFAVDSLTITYTGEAASVSGK